MKLKTVLLLVISLMLTAEEVSVTATNTMKFGIGREWAGDNKDEEVEKQYFEDWIDVEAVKGDFTAGLRFEAADPSSFNEKLKDVTRLYFGYSKDKINITAGDFYGSFGRGLVLGLKETKADFFDSKITGGKFDYCGEYFGFKALGGKSYFKYLNDLDPDSQTVEQMNNAVLGSEVNLPLSTYFGMKDVSFNLGGSYLYIEGDDVPEGQYLYNDMFIKKTNIGGVSVDISAYDIEFFNEYAVKTTDRLKTETGWANYTSITYAVEGFSIGLEYKDYQKYGANPNEPSSGFTPYQTAPDLIINHSSHLLNTHPHEVNPNDEIGYKLSSVYKLNEKTDINGSAAVSSFHNGNSIIPETSDEYHPYIDSWLGTDYTEEKYGVSGGLGYFSDSPILKDEKQNRLTFTGDYFFKLNEISKIKFCGEFQKVDIDYALSSYADIDFNDIYGSVEYSYSPYGYINVSLITTSQDVADDAPDSWFGIEAGINIRENHKLELFYGRERAGIKCSGGTCRQVPEFDGFRMTLVSDF